MAKVKVVSAKYRDMRIATRFGTFDIDGEGCIEVEQEVAEQFCDPEIYGTTMDGKPSWSMVVSTPVEEPAPSEEEEVVEKTIIENPSDAMKAKLAEKKAAKG